MTDGPPKPRKMELPAKPRSTAARVRLLSIEVTSDVEDDGSAGKPAGSSIWAGLGEAEAAMLATEVAGAIASSVALPEATTAATLMLSDDANVAVLNKQWRGFDKPTNVLSFPMQAPPGKRGKGPFEIGDIVIAGETLVREASEMGISVRDHFRHLVLHGLLHLLGYDHENDDEAEVMEALETRILATIGVADPYAGSDPIGGDGAAQSESRGTRLR